MTTNDYPRLCGGTFFSLLLEARKPRPHPKTKDGLSDPDVLFGLIKLGLPSYPSPLGKSFSTKTSEYKTCHTSSASCLPFTESSYVSALDEIVKNEYSEGLVGILHFTNNFIEPTMIKFLVASLLELIDADKSIAKTELFYYHDKQNQYTKEELCALKNITYEPFLLSIWNYIVINRRNNKIGAETYETWYPRPKFRGAKRKFISNIGEKYKRIIRVSEVSTTTQPKDDKQSDYYLDCGITPELTENPPFIIVPDANEAPASKYSVYLDNAYAKYSKLKTLLYNDYPRPFYDFYVRNKLYQRISTGKNSYTNHSVPNTSAEEISSLSNFIIITGTGGLGKSMIMRHLLLNAIENFQEENNVPVFIPLKDYDNSYADLLEFIFKKITTLGWETSLDEFKELLQKGRFLLLLDGLDEINSSCRKDFETKLEFFADRYSSNSYIMSSRPYGSFISYNRFTVLELQPFDLKQSLELIDKLDFRPDEPSIKEHFKNDLEQKFYYSHREFTQNPLLLTIMLMTYEQFAEIPSKMYVFYHDAYLALSQKHDASKGAFKRALRTGLTAEKFSDYFAEFCARTYRDEKFDLTDTDCKNYFSELNERKKDTNKPTATDFMFDLTTNLCLMFYESQKYHFTHRSFQEYFSALFFSRQKDKNLPKIGDFFDHRRVRNYSDKTFDMLYDMIPEKVEEYIFLPYLENLITTCAKEDGYKTFLETLYPTIYYDVGEVASSVDNTPSSFLYDFIIRKANIEQSIGNDVFPSQDEFITDAYVEYNENWKLSCEDEEFELINANELDSEYIREYGMPDEVGWNLEFGIEEIYNDPEYYEEIIDVLEDSFFPLKQEYQAIQVYLIKLKKKQQATGTDLFDFLSS